MPVVCFLNQKGGVGKTSTCHHLAGALVKEGRSVLLVDNDPQGSLTQGLLGPQVTRALAPPTTIHAVLAGDEPFPSQVLRPVYPGVALLAGSGRAAEYNVPLPWRLPRDAQDRLRDFLDEVKGDYDHVLVDCPPNLHLCSWAALLASDHLVVPLQPEDYGAQGLADVQDSVDRAHGPNPGLALAGYLITRINVRKSLHKTYMSMLQGLYGDAVFAALVPDAVDYPEAISARLPVSQYKPRGAAAKAMTALALELEARIANQARGAA